MEEGKRALGQNFGDPKCWGNGQLGNFWSPGSNTPLGTVSYSYVIGSGPDLIRSQAQSLLQA